MSLIETVKTALGGTFETVKTARSSYQTNGTFTVRALRNQNVQVELHDLKNSQGMNFIQKGRLGSQICHALTKAGVSEDDIQVSNGSYDNRGGGEKGVWRAWPSVYVAKNVAAGDTKASATAERLVQLEAMVARLQASAEQATPTTEDGDGAVVSAETEAEATDF
jgi:hypothetical protein